MTKSIRLLMALTLLMVTMLVGTVARAIATEETQPSLSLAVGFAAGGDASDVAAGPLGWGVSQTWHCNCPPGQTAWVIFESGNGWVQFEAFGYDFQGGVPAYGVARHTCRTGTCMWYGTATPLNKSTVIQRVVVSSKNWVHIWERWCGAAPFVNK